MLRLFKMIKYFDGFMSQFVVRELLRLLKFLKIFCFMLLAAHLAACAWFFVGYSSMESETGSWVSVQFGLSSPEQVDELPVFDKYSYAWYWAGVTVKSP